MSGGRGMVRAASTTRRTSSLVIMWSGRVMDTVAELLMERMCFPAIPTYTLSTRTSAMFSASSTAFRIDWMVRPMSTTTPFSNPREGDMPIPMISMIPSTTLATRQHTFVVPTSSPTTSRSRLIEPPPSSWLEDDLAFPSEVDLRVSG